MVTIKGYAPRPRRLCDCEANYCPRHRDRDCTEKAVFQVEAFGYLQNLCGPCLDEARVYFNAPEQLAAQADLVANRTPTRLVRATKGEGAASRVRVICCRCHKWVPIAEAFADLDGQAFTAYYHEGCLTAEEQATVQLDGDDQAAAATVWGGVYPE